MAGRWCCAGTAQERSKNRALALALAFKAQALVVGQCGEAFQPHAWIARELRRPSRPLSYNIQPHSSKRCYDLPQDERTTA